MGGTGVAPSAAAVRPKWIVAPVTMTMKPSTNAMTAMRSMRLTHGTYTCPIVSSDVIGNPASSVFDSLTTTVMDSHLVKVLSWYDNEWGFSNRVVDALVKMA